MVHLLIKPPKIRNHHKDRQIALPKSLGKKPWQKALARKELPRTFVPGIGGGKCSDKKVITETLS
ncbi:MAG: hypothetical protein A3G20_07990 [Acidobacteria bacterium RIFCSPLOWO2_12_FULL_59_11]|nr:MAG: hypothetical protein A3G20_07990 [Acidobacteria bacterium RIFCSPLOWO2_12_FULL_59_11]